VREGHIYIDGIIENDYHLTVKRQLDALDADKIILHIQSPGGSVYAGYNTYHVLKTAGKPIEAIIEGECQSIATFISLAANKVIARNPSVYMIHNPYTEIQGDASAMESGASELRKIEETIAEAYHSKTKLPLERIKEMMRKETSMTAAEAKELGFVDEVVDTLKMVALGKPKNKMEKNIFDNFGAKMAAALKEVFGGPKNMEVPLKDGTILFVESEDGNFMGKKAMIENQPAPAGSYELANGTIIVVGEGGVITEVKEAMTPEQRLQEENKALKAELEALKAQSQNEKVALETQVQEAKAKNETTAQMLADLNKEFQELRKKTVGDPAPPKAAPVAQVKPGTPQVDELTAAFIDEYLPHLKQK